MGTTYPYYMPFDFAGLAAGAQAEVRLQAWGDFLIEGITVFDSSAGLTSFRTLIYDDFGLIKIMSDEISSSAFESDAQFPFKFPTPILWPRGLQVITRVRNVSTIPIANLQICLYGRIAAVQSIPAPAKISYIYSYYITLGRPGTNSAAATDSFNLGLVGALGFPVKEFDFELISIGMDDQTLGPLPAFGYRLQLVDRHGMTVRSMNLVNRGSIAGANVGQALAAIGVAVPAGLPAFDCLLHTLPIPYTFKAGNQISIRICQNPQFLTQAQYNTRILDQTVNLLLIGNKIYEQS